MHTDLDHMDSVKSHRGRRENFGWHDQIKLHGDGET